MADRQNVLMGVTPDVVEAAHILVMMKHGMKAFIEAQNSCHRFPYLYYASLNPTISAQLHYFASHGFPFNSPFYDFSAAPSTYQLPLLHAQSFTIPPQDAYCGMLTPSKCIVGPPRDHCPSGEALGDGNADQETTQPVAKKARLAVEFTDRHTNRTAYCVRKTRRKKKAEKPYKRTAGDSRISYKKEKYPHMDDRIKLEKSTNLSEDRIQVWFQNRRAKDRKRIEAERLQHYFENNSRINEDFTLNNVKEERNATKNNTSGDVSDNER
ncbi:homeobox protein rough-like [Acropora millepora]|uniref:homeobox protein rough-like n=1 Tax=Acropora millepora TaxID=45264 RepID=UPI001CF390F4|nr:homeobox protein rough-like [Acropora millepora]